MKYIIDDMQQCAIFPEYVNHAQVAKAFDPNLSVIVNAGFCTLRLECDHKLAPPGEEGAKSCKCKQSCSPTCAKQPTLQVTCYGSSVSLGVGSKPEDAQIIARTLASLSLF